MKSSGYLFVASRKAILLVIRTISNKIILYFGVIDQAKNFTKLKFDVVIFGAFSTVIETWLYDAVLTNMMTSVY